MHSMIRSISTSIVTLFDTFTMGSVILNYLARAGVERSVVVEEKARSKAALSQFENETNVALRLEEADEAHASLTPESRARAQEFLADYDQKRETKAIVKPLRIKQAEKKKPVRKTRKI